MNRTITRTEVMTTTSVLGYESRLIATYSRSVTYTVVADGSKYETSQAAKAHLGTLEEVSTCNLQYVAVTWP